MAQRRRLGTEVSTGGAPVSHESRDATKYSELMRGFSGIFRLTMDRRVGETHDFVQQLTAPLPKPDEWGYRPSIQASGLLVLTASLTAQQPGFQEWIAQDPDAWSQGIEAAMDLTYLRTGDVSDVAERTAFAREIAAKTREGLEVDAAFKLAGELGAVGFYASGMDFASLWANRMPQESDDLCASCGPQVTAAIEREVGSQNMLPKNVMPGAELVSYVQAISAN